MDAVRLHAHAVFDLHDGHRRLPAKEIGKHALPRRIEMLNDDETHAAVCWHRIQKCGCDFEPACRHADAHDWERPPNTFRSFTAKRLGCRSPSGS